MKQSIFEQTVQERLQELLEQRKELLESYGGGKLPINLELGQAVEKGSYKVLFTNKSLDFLSFELGRSLLDAIEYAESGLGGLGKYLENVEFGVGRRGFQHSRIVYDIPITEDELEQPVLPSLLEDGCIIVKIIDNTGYRYEVPAKARVGDFEIPLTAKVRDPQHIDRKWRSYKFDCNDRGEELSPEAIIQVGRFPVFLNTYLTTRVSRISRYTDFAKDVLRQNLEPITTSQILGAVQRVLDLQGPLDDDEYSGILDYMHRSEYALTAGIVMNWLYQTRASTKFDLSDIFESLGIPPEGNHEFVQAYKAAKQKGIQRSIEFYRSEDWDIDCFLKGDF